MWRFLCLTFLKACHIKADLTTNIQHLPVSLKKIKRERHRNLTNLKVPEVHTTDGIYLDDFYLFKAFEMVPQNNLDSKLERYGFDGCTILWIKNRMDDCIQRVAAKGSMSKWRSVTSSVPQGSVLGWVLFSIFINGIDGGIERTLSRLADDTRLSGVVDTLEGRDAMQRGLHRLKEWAYANPTRFNKAKCKVLHLGQGNLQYQYKLGDE